MTDFDRLNWLDNFLSYNDIRSLFGKAGIANDGAPKTLRIIIDNLSKLNKSDLEEVKDDAESYRSQ